MSALDPTQGPNSFSTDGAAGAGGFGAPGAPPAPGSTSAPGASAGGDPYAGDYYEGNSIMDRSGNAIGTSGQTADKWMTPAAADKQQAAHAGDFYGAWNAPTFSSPGATATHAPGASGTAMPLGNPMFMAEGGAIPDDPNATDPQGSGMGSQLQQSINAALGTVDNVLSYGRKLHGLGGGGGDEGAIKGTQIADRMPTVPGSPSNSGVKPIQPTPGALPPTSNPFGKRADNDQDQDKGGDTDNDNDGGAIDTEETA